MTKEFIFFLFFVINAQSDQPRGLNSLKLKVFVYVYIHIHTYVYTHTYTHIHTYVCARV